jgi:hypothetical protein
MYCKTKSILLAILTFFIFLLFSCQNKVDLDQGPISVSIIHSSGDDYLKNEENQVVSFLPYPTNFASLESNGISYDVFLLSKKIEKGTQVGILPFREIHFKDSDSGYSRVVLALPTDQSLRLLLNGDVNMEDEDNLFSAIHLIQYWYSNKEGLNGNHIVLDKAVTFEDYKY